MKNTPYENIASKIYYTRPRKFQFSPPTIKPFYLFYFPIDTSTNYINLLPKNILPNSSLESHPLSRTSRIFQKITFGGKKNYSRQNRTSLMFNLFPPPLKRLKNIPPTNKGKSNNRRDHHFPLFRIKKNFRIRLKPPKDFHRSPKMTTEEFPRDLHPHPLSLSLPRRRGTLNYTPLWPYPRCSASSIPVANIRNLENCDKFILEGIVYKSPWNVMYRYRKWERGYFSLNGFLEKLENLRNISV